MAGATFALIGDKELVKKLQSLNKSVANKIMRPAVVKGLKPVRASARNKVRKRSGLLAQAISARAKTSRRGVVGMVYVRNIQGAVVSCFFEPFDHPVAHSQYSKSDYFVIQAF